MILGVGHDLAYVPRFVTLLRTRSDRRVARLAQRILHPRAELPVFAAVAAGTGQAAAARYLANAWACKEALFKSLSAADQRACRFNDWYKSHTAEGRPTIQCDEYAKAHPAEQFHLSVSHDGDYLSAFIIRSLNS